MSLPSIATAAHTVLISGQAWTQVSSLIGAGPHDPVYAIRTTADGAAEVQFGNGRQGRRPPAGSLIEVRYRSNGASQGNVANAAPGIFAPATSIVVSVQSAAGGLHLTPRSGARRKHPDP